MASRFEGKLVRLTAGKPGDGAVFARWDAEQTESARLLYEIGFPRPQTLLGTPSEDKPPDGDNFPFTIETLAGEVVGGIHVQKCDPRSGTFMYGLAIFPPQQQKATSRLALETTEPTVVWGPTLDSNRSPRSTSRCAA